MTHRKNILIAAMLAASASCALSQPGLTRAQVRAELQEAIRTGNIQGGGDRSEPLNVRFPHRYPQRASISAGLKPLD